MILRCGKGHDRDTGYPFNRHLKPGMKCGEVTNYDRMCGSTYCGAILVLDIEYPEPGRRLVKQLHSGKTEARTVESFRPGGAGYVIYQSSLKKTLAGCTYKKWRQWAKDATIEPLQVKAA